MMDWLCSQYSHFINGQSLLPVIFQVITCQKIPQVPTNSKGLSLKIEAGHKCEVQQIKLEFHHMASGVSRVGSDIKNECV